MIKHYEPNLATSIVERHIEYILGFEHETEDVIEVACEFLSYLSPEDIEEDCDEDDCTQVGGFWFAGPPHKVAEELVKTITDAVDDHKFGVEDPTEGYAPRSARLPTDR